MMARGKRAMTLAEHDALLKSDGGYDEMKEVQRIKAEELERKTAAWRQAEAPLVEELHAVGMMVDSAWELVNTSTPYPEALPILLEHLERPYPDRVREGIARALAVRGAKFGWETLTRLYLHEEAGTDAKHGLAVAIAAASDDEVIDEVISLARTPAHGGSRILLLRALARSRDPKARLALEELAEDSELSQEARSLLGVDS